MAIRTDDKKVIIVRNSKARYPVPPFSPSEKYPEYPFKDKVATDKNDIYDMVRNLLRDYGFDKENYGTADWNPLRTLITPGNNVLIKPNAVKHSHPRGLGVESIITHGSVIRAVLDYVYLALDGRGSVVIGDASLQSCDFDKLRAINGLDAIKDVYSGSEFKLSIADFRLVKAVKAKRPGDRCGLAQEALSGDPLGYTQVNMGEFSCFHSVRDKFKDFRVTCYNPKKMKSHHNNSFHEYIISNTALKADVIINIPKMKTHRKAGITGALKNMVGINGHKDCLPHHRKGSKQNGADEYLYQSTLKEMHSWLLDRSEEASGSFLKNSFGALSHIFRRVAWRLARDKYFEGSWWGNDTIWRTILDLNKILRYADKDGNLTSAPFSGRRMFTIVDGVVAGEGDGPLSPDPIHCGMLICGTSPVAVDTVMSKAVGFDYKKIPQISNAFDQERYTLSDFAPNSIKIRLSDDEGSSDISLSELSLFNFKPYFGWCGYLDRNIE